MPAVRDRSFDLLGALMGAASPAASARAVTRALAFELARHVPLAAFELAWVDGDGPDAEVVLVLIGGSEADCLADSFARPRDESAGVQALGRGAPGLFRADARTEPWRERDVAEGVGAAWYLCLPIAGQGGRRGFAVLYLDAPGHARPRLDEELLALVARFFGVLQDRGRLVRRLAQRCRANTRRLADVLEAAALGDGAAAPLVARSAGMVALEDALAAAARSPRPALIEAERGAGRGLVARHLHARSGRRGAFVRLDGGAIDAATRLFGRAAPRRAGLVDLAAGGTLYISGVERLPAAAQPGLADLAAGGGYHRPVGGRRRVDVRIVLSSAWPLEVLVAEHGLDAALAAEIHERHLAIPPLRARADDLPELARVLLADAAARFGRPAPELDVESLTLLSRRAWPGNGRELNQLLEGALLAAKGRDHIPAELLDPVATAPPTRLDDAIRACIVRALRATRGRIYGAGGAAEILGLPPSTLQSKMVKLGVSRDPYVC